MSDVKVIYYNTTCTCPEWNKKRECSGDCTECSYPTLHQHIVTGKYKKIDYDEENNTFTYGNKKILIDDSCDECFPEWIEYLEIDGNIIIDIEGGDDIHV